MQCPRLALSVLIAATLCLPLVVGQPAAGTYLTRCNPGATAAFNFSDLTNASSPECCMWTFPGAAATTEGALVRTGSCINATGETLDLSSKKINSIAAADFQNIGTLKTLDLSYNTKLAPNMKLTTPLTNQFANLTSLTVLKLRNIGLTSSTQLMSALSALTALTTTDLSGNVLGQPAAGTYLTRCNPGETVAFDTSVDPVVGLTSTSAGVCCMWTFPGAAAVSAGPLARTGSCPNAKGELLDLSGMKINSIAASNFANIGDLKTLDLSDNPNMTAPTNQFASLTSLTVLKLRNIGLTSNTLVLDALTALKTLDLSGNSFTTLPKPPANPFPTALTQLVFAVPSNHWKSKLRCNDPLLADEALSTNFPASAFNPQVCCLWGGTKNAAGALQRLGKCASATTAVIDLSGSATGPTNQNINAIATADFADCGTPQTLLLNNNQITTISSFTFPSSLTSLDMSNNALPSTGTLSFESLTALTDLKLSSIGRTTLDGLTFPNPSGLKTLDMSLNTLPAAGDLSFASLTSLTDLKLNSIGRNFLNFTFPNPTGLKTLDMSNNALPATGALSFSSLTALMDLKLSSIGRTTLDSFSFPNPTGLRTLDLSSNSLPSTGALSFATLTALTDLKLNSIGRTTLQSLTFPITLKKLDLSSNSLPSTDPLSFETLTALTDLKLISIGRTTLVGLTLPPSCKNFDISGNTFALTSLNTLTSITELKLTGVTANTLASATFPPNLNSLDLSNNAALNSLVGVTFPAGLKNLNLQGCSITSIDKPTSRRSTGVMFPAGMTKLNLAGNQISSLANAKFPDALTELSLNAQIGTPRLTSLANVVFPDSIKLLDLSVNEIASITGVKFPLSLTHLNLRQNRITSINGVTIALKECNLLAQDADCTLDPPNAQLSKSVDLSLNLLTSISGATFRGTIVKLDLSGTSTTNKLEVFPAMTFPSVLSQLRFHLDTTKVWNSEVYCNGVLPVATNFAVGSTLNSINPSACCMWGGLKWTSGAGSQASPYLPQDRPLERMGKCLTAQYTSGIGLVLTGNTGSNQLITAIPPDSDPRNDVFSEIGEPKELKLDGNSITTLTGVYLPTSLIILSLKNNQIVKLSGLQDLSALKVLDVENNLLTCITSIQLPAALTHLSLKNNRIGSITNVTIALKKCVETTDMSCRLSNYADSTQYSAYSTLAESVDLSGNLLTSISGAKFEGSIVKLDLRASGANNNPFTTLPIGASFPTTLTQLFFDDPNGGANRWRSSKRCDDMTLQAETAQYWPGNSFNPNKCCLWGGSKAEAGAPLERLGTCSAASDGFISLRYNANMANLAVRFIATLPTVSAEKITSIPPDAFDNCGTPLGIEITDQPKLTSIANVKFPGSLRILDLGDNGLASLADASFPSSMLRVLHLGNNKITSIHNVFLPKTLTHLSLNNNRISSISNVTLTLETCQSSGDTACTLSAPTYPTYALTRSKSVDLSNNMLTSISGSTFLGQIVKLDLSGTTGTNPFKTLPIGASFSPTLTELVFNPPLAPRWRSMKRCDSTALESELSPYWPLGSFDPTKCCMWGGSNAGAPLERLGKCSSATGPYISLRKTIDVADQRFVPFAARSLQAAQGITAIPADSFDFCGSPLMLEITDQPLTSIANVRLPNTLKVLDLGDNQLASLAGAAFSSATLRFLYLGNNKITSFETLTFPNTLTFLDLSRNRIRSLEGVAITLSECSSAENTGNLVAACGNTISGSPMFSATDPLRQSSKILILKDNLITSIARATFGGLIETLRLDQNRIYALTGVTFTDNLKVLRLENNMITALADLRISPPSVLRELHLENNKISSVSGMTFPNFITDLNLKNNKISSFANMMIPNSIKKLDISVNPIIGLDLDVDPVNTGILNAFRGSPDPFGTSLTSWINLPLGLKCIPVAKVMTWVNSRIGIGTFGDCTWSVTRCNPDSSTCCVWSGSHIGSPVTRSGTCSLATQYAIDLSDRGITAIPLGAFANIGKPESLKLNNNRISTLRLSDNSIVQLPDSLTYLDLSGNRIESLAGVTFSLTNCELPTPSSCVSGQITTPSPTSCQTDSSNQVRLNLQNNLLTSLTGATFKADNIKLNLANNKIASLTGVQFPASTSELDLSDNQISSLDDLTFSFTSCRRLNVNRNEITSFAGTKFLGVIEELSLQNVNMKGMTTLAGVTFDLKKCTSSPTCTTTVVMNQNRITSLAGAKFSGENYEMKFEDNQITSIAGATFEAKKCRLLDLGNNEIPSLAGATFAGAIGTLNLEKNEIKSLAGATFKGSIAILDLKENQITSLAGVTFDFLKCDASFETNCDLPANLKNREIVPGNMASVFALPLLNLANNKITSFAGGNFAGSIKTLSVAENPLISLVGVEKFFGITKLILPSTKIPPEGLIGVSLPETSAIGLGEIQGLTVDCIPSPSFVLRTRLSEDFLYDNVARNGVTKPSFQICAPRFWTRCDPDANVEERCFPSFATASNPPRPPSAWTPSASNCVPTNIEKCCIWSQAFPGAPLVREGICNQAVGGGIDLSGAGLTSFPSGAFDNVGSPRFMNLENNKLTSLSGVKLADSLQALILNNNEIASLTDVKFPASLQVVHLHQNAAGLTCVSLPKVLMDSTTYIGPPACPTSPPPSMAPTTRPPSPPSTTPSPPSPAAVPVAKTDNFVQLVVSLPYTKASFDQDKQLKFRAALAASAGTTAENVEITSITEGRRRQGQGIKVENKIYAKDAASAEKLSSTLGTGSGALDKVNSELQKQGLEKSTGLDLMSANNSDNTGLIVGLVVGLGGGAIIIVAIAAYYLYVVKPPAQLPPTTKDLENAPVVPPSAPIVAPAASLGVPSPARMPAPSTLVFDAYDFTNWSKSGAPGYQTTQPGYQTTQPGYQNQAQYGAMPRFNM